MEEEDNQPEEVEVEEPSQKTPSTKGAVQSAQKLSQPQNAPDGAVGNDFGMGQLQDEKPEASSPKRVSAPQTEESKKVEEEPKETDQNKPKPAEGEPVEEAK